MATPARSQQSTLVCIFLALFTFEVPALVAESREDREAAKQLIDAWEARQKRLDSVRIAWKITRFRKQSSIMSPATAKEHELGEPATTKGLPIADYTATFPSKLFLKGSEWMRYRTQQRGFGKDWSSRGSGTHESSYDGRSSRMMSRSIEGERHGSIRQERRNTDAHSYPLSPLLLWARPFFKSGMPIDRKGLAVKDRNTVIDGRKHWLVEETHLRAWVDPQRDFTVSKMEFLLPDGSVIYRGTMQYRKQQDDGWVPKKWTIEALSRSPQPIVEQRETGVVNGCKLDLPQTQDSFILEFPPGTIVWDAKRGKEFRIDRDGNENPLDR